MPKSVKRARMVSIGLCGTCSNYPLCTFPRKPDVPVMNCLEFEGETLDEDQRASKASPRPPRNDPDPPAHEPGLCFWCENKLTCAFPRQPGGVWSCEEFQ